MAVPVLTANAIDLIKICPARTDHKSIPDSAKMKTYIALIAALVAQARAAVKGFDISHYQSSVDFDGAYAAGLRFVYIKATEGTTYKDPAFSDHYTDATDAGFIRGAYHFANGDSSATIQAQYFAENGGGWTADGITLPGMLDLEGDCIDADWIQEFSDEYYSITTRYPVLYSSPSWWEECTGDSSAFVDTNPLMMACWSDEACDPQGGWSYYTIWQYADSNDFGGDSDEFNGDTAGLAKLASG